MRFYLCLVKIVEGSDMEKIKLAMEKLMIGLSEDFIKKMFS